LWSLLFYSSASFGVFAKESSLDRLLALDLQTVNVPFPTYYSEGVRARAENLAKYLAEMQRFFDHSLGLKPKFNLAVLSSNDWKKVTNLPYGLPQASDAAPYLIILPATSRGFAFDLIMARIPAVPSGPLQEHLRQKRVALETLVEQFVDTFPAYHELGHILSDLYLIDNRYAWLGEFTASYFAYSFAYERDHETKILCDVFGRPSHARPKHTLLADFERLHAEVEDVGWYQGMFELRIRELYPDKRLEFLKELQAHFPLRNASSREQSRKLSPKEVIEILERIAPGFRQWAEGFGD
jgi:hypothetical protein